MALYPPRKNSGRHYSLTFNVPDEAEKRLSSVSPVNPDFLNFAQIEENVTADPTIANVSLIMLKMKQLNNETVINEMASALVKQVQQNACQEVDYHPRLQQALQTAAEHRKAIRFLTEEVPSYQNEIVKAVERRDEIINKLNDVISRFKLGHKDMYARRHFYGGQCNELSSMAADKEAATTVTEKTLEVEKRMHRDYVNARIAEAERQILVENESKVNDYAALQRVLETYRAERDALASDLEVEESKIMGVKGGLEDIGHKISQCNVTRKKHVAEFSALSKILRNARTLRERLKRMYSASSLVLSVAEEDNRTRRKELQEENAIRTSLINDNMLLTKNHDELEANVKHLRNAASELAHQCQADSKHTAAIKRKRQKKEANLQDLDRVLIERTNEWEFCIARLQNLNSQAINSENELGRVAYHKSVMVSSIERVQTVVNRLLRRHNQLNNILDKKMMIPRKLQKTRMQLHQTRSGCTRNYNILLEENDKLNASCSAMERNNILLEKGNRSLEIHNLRKHEQLDNINLVNHGIENQMKMAESYIHETKIKNKRLDMKNKAQREQQVVNAKKILQLHKDMAKGIETRKFLETKIDYMIRNIVESKREQMWRNMSLLDIRRQRDFFGSTLIKTNREFELHADVLNVHENLQNMYKRQYTAYTGDMDLLKREYGRLRRRLNFLKEQIDTYHFPLKYDNRKQHRELMALKTRCSAIEEGRSQVLLHRWRYLWVVEPNKYSVMREVQLLNTRMTVATNNANRLRAVKADRDTFLVEMLKVYARRQPEAILNARSTVVNGKYKKTSKRIEILECDLEESKCTLDDLEKKKNDALQKKKQEQEAKQRNQRGQKTVFRIPVSIDQPAEYVDLITMPRRRHGHTNTNICDYRFI